MAGCGTPLTSIMLKDGTHMLYQFPSGAQRTATPRFIWSCRKCYMKNRRGTLPVNWAAIAAQYH